MRDRRFSISQNGQKEQQMIQINAIREILKMPPVQRLTGILLIAISVLSSVIIYQNHRLEVKDDRYVKKMEQCSAQISANTAKSNREKDSISAFYLNRERLDNDRAKEKLYLRERLIDSAMAAARQLY